MKKALSVLRELPEYISAAVPIVIVVGIFGFLLSPLFSDSKTDLLDDACKAVGVEGCLKPTNQGKRLLQRKFETLFTPDQIGAIGGYVDEANREFSRFERSSIMVDILKSRSSDGMASIDFLDFDTVDPAYKKDLSRVPVYGSRGIFDGERGKLENILGFNSDLSVRVDGPSSSNFAKFVEACSRYRVRCVFSYKGVVDAVSQEGKDGGSNYKGWIEISEFSPLAKAFTVEGVRDRIGLDAALSFIRAAERGELKTVEPSDLQKILRKSIETGLAKTNMSAGL